MPPNDIPEAVCHLISQHIRSVERLEILLLLFESRPQRWRIEEIEERIRSTRDSVSANVAKLVEVQMLEASQEVPVHFHYGGSELLDAVMADLVTTYRIRRVAVIGLIYADRHDSLRDFSDAFQIRKKQ